MSVYQYKIVMMTQTHPLVLMKNLMNISTGGQRNRSNNLFLFVFLNAHNYSCNKLFIYYLTSYTFLLFHYVLHLKIKVAKELISTVIINEVFLLQLYVFKTFVVKKIQFLLL